ncbi:YeeE/YedE family protein [Spirochaeta lutea]|uniref:YeeE/YedE family protein n=1 Tax=Spirochaeta lutea TaxID=1480694 RepID=UPI00055DCBAF|nr:YeeE/YedE thiosulfate transporter family protein [Spirochaeta lutea]
MTEVIYWSGWIGGIGIGAYALAQFLLTGKHLGVSTAFGNVCGLISRRAFFHKGPYTDNLNWRLWFILGIPLGGLIAALTSPGPLVASFSLGDLYDSVLPQALPLKGLVLTLGGTLIGLGSRLAGGCTSGHSIAGLGLLNPPSLAASAGFFAGGILIVQFLFNIL